VGYARDIDGGNGDDVLTSLPYSSYLRGGAGNDQLTGFHVTGGPGDDVLSGTFLEYGDHTAGVTFDVAGGTGGAAGEHDRIVPGFGFVTGGSGPDVIRAGTDLDVEAGGGDDTLYGGPGSNHLQGEEGDDRLFGEAGDDYLDGGPGDDVLDGGAGRDELSGYEGADRILARDGEDDHVDCSQSRLEDDKATVEEVDGETFGCNRVDREDARRLEPHAVIRTGRRTRVFVTSCPKSARRAACAGRIRFGRGGRTEQVAFEVAPGRRERIRITLRHRDLYSPRVVLRTGLRLSWIAELRAEL
jgi:hypothetical protein